MTLPEALTAAADTLRDHPMAFVGLYRREIVDPKTKALRIEYEVRLRAWGERQRGANDQDTGLVLEQHRVRWTNVTTPTLPEALLGALRSRPVAR